MSRPPVGARAPLLEPGERREPAVALGVTRVTALGTAPGRLRLGALLVAAALAATAYSWSLGHAPLANYYGAAARSMAMSWRNFLFGALDPAGTVTTDKLPGGFWVQALSVRLFGFHTWAIVVPQVVEGVLSVLVLFRAVSRLAGPTAGLVAAFVLALSPAAVAQNRGNVPDSLLILFLVLAADALSRALRDERRRWLLLAALWVGLGFQAKMVEAWMAMPALGATYLIGGPGTTARRARDLAVAGGVAVVVSLSWMTAISLVPAHDRPYVDGSDHNSVYQQVFVYNGFGRFGEQTPMQLLAREALGPAAGRVNAEPPGPGRLLTGVLARNSAWLMPAAAAVALWGIASRRGRGRSDPLRLCFVLWFLWLLTFAVAFSFSTTIVPYYTAVLSPAVAALLGAGVAAAWDEHRDRAARRIGLVLLMAGTTAYAIWLLPPSGTAVTGWLAPSIVAVGATAMALGLLSLATRRDVVFAAAIVGALSAACLAPAVGAEGIVAHDQGPFDVAFESANEARAVQLAYVEVPRVVGRLIPDIVKASRGTPYLAASQTALIAAEFIYVSGLEVLPIGGFTGTFPSPTLHTLKQDIALGRFHVVFSLSENDPRIRWIDQHCLHVGTSLAVLRTSYCLSASAR